MDNDDAVMVYAVEFPGHPGYGAVSVDLPEYTKETAKFVAAQLRRGGIVHRVTLKEARDGMRKYLDAW